MEQMGFFDVSKEEIESAKTQDRGVQESIFRKSKVNTNISVKRARAWLGDHVAEGEHCPCCGRWTQVYKYAFHAGMAKVLLIISKAYDQGVPDDGGWFHVEDYMSSKRETIKGYHGKLKFWGMLEQKPNDDSKKKWSGYWRITDKGKSFLRGELSVPKNALLYDNDCFGFSGPEVFFKDVVGEYFDYTAMLDASKASGM